MASRPAKRPRLGVYRDRVPTNLHTDYSTISSREERLTVSSRPAVTSRTSLRGDTSWYTGPKWEPPRDNAEIGLEPDSSWFDEAVEAPIVVEKKRRKRKKKPKSLVSKRPNIVWKSLYRQSYLDEMLRWEGRGDVRGEIQCPDCLRRGNPQPGAPQYRCLECFIPDLVCADCCVRRHQQQPLHTIEKYDGTFFSRSQLKDLGLVIQLGHVSLHCPQPEAGPSDFQILHSNGIHNVAIRYCGCERSLPRHIQLLRRAFYPSSQLRPKTCATFSLLRLLHNLALCSKASTYDFYRTLEVMTDNTGLKKRVSKYKPLVRMVIQWRHLKMLKRGGRGHDPIGVSETKDGELAVPCLTCPRPGVNLPEGWEKASAGQRFLYQLVLCMDANFRLKNQLVSSFSSDPGLGIGWAYMVPRQPYEDYVKSQATAQDVSTCVGFSALAKANTKFSKGLRYTGVGAITCGRSEMFLPCGVGNLQKGESYDVACQWIVNLSKRMVDWPEGYKIPSTTQIRPAIPKMHETAHEKEKHERFSLHYLPGVGLTDGESIERIWAGHNALGNATKSMGPGTRHDVLDDHFGFWNWLKYIGTGKTLSKKYRDAVKLRNIQTEAHRGFTATISGEQVKEWEKMCQAWDQEPYPKSKSSNPFHVEGSSISEAQARKELAEEEELRLKAGEVSRHATSASAFLVLGLELEEEQRRIASLSKKSRSPTTLQKGSITEQRNQLRDKLRGWEQVRNVYMPGLLQYQHDNPVTLVTDHPEDCPLWLPSSLPPEKRDIVCVPRLAAAEEKLRTAQCYDTLDTIRQVLNMKSRMVRFKNANIRGQRDGTRSRAIIDRVHNRARFAALRYTAAREAKLSLGGPGEWEDDLKILQAGDVRSYTDPNRVHQGPGRPGTIEEDADPSLAVVDPMPDPLDLDNIDLLPQERNRRDGTGETRRTVSWIWLRGRSMHKNEENDDLLRSEWAKSRSRVLRAEEEVSILKEEMRRAVLTLQWQAGEWKSRASLRSVADSSLREGLMAFAAQQASLHLALQARFVTVWKDPLAHEEKEEEEKEGGEEEEEEEEVVVDEEDDDNEHDVNDDIDDDDEDDNDDDDDDDDDDEDDDDEDEDEDDDES
ncbi:hypothetical protein H0H93_014961 [Arthromyces matolae]|nr:hypothetical protein H0H93_014961 [Arthromyces matolae]